MKTGATLHRELQQHGIPVETVRVKNGVAEIVFAPDATETHKAAAHIIAEQFDWNAAEPLELDRAALAVFLQTPRAQRTAAQRDDAFEALLRLALNL